MQGTVDESRRSNLTAMQRSYARGEGRPAAGPREAYIEVAARCNLRCVMCPITVDPRYAPGSGRAALLSDELFERIAELAPTLQRAHLFGLGEPLLHPRLFEYGARLAELGVEVWTTTNATLVGPAEAERFAEAGFARVSVSIDGATRETYERIRRRGRFEDVLRGLRSLGEVRRRRGRPELTLSMVGTASNLEELPLLVELASEVGADAVFLEELYGWEHPGLREVVERERLSRLGVALSARIDERYGRSEPIAPEDDGSGAAPLDPGAPADPLAPSALEMAWPCSEPWSTVNVNASGEVRTCCFNDTVLGDLATSGLREIWRGDAYARLRRALAAGRSVASCDGCVKAGRVKRSPYLLPESGGEDPPDPPPGFRLQAPGDGEAVEGVLVLSGTLDPPEPRSVRAGRRFLRRLRLRGIRGAYRLERLLFGADRRQGLPEIHLDDRPLSTGGDRVEVLDHWFTARLPIPFVSEGAHVVRVTAPAEQGGALWARRTVMVWRPKAEAGPDARATAPAGPAVQ